MDYDKFNGIEGDFDPDRLSGDYYSGRRREYEPQEEGRETSADRSGGGRPERRTNRSGDVEVKRKRKVKERKPKARQEKAWKDNSIVKFLCDSRLHAFVGACLIFFAGYLTVASISFIRSGAEDQSVLHEMTVGQIVSAGEKIDNVAGPAGAALAQSIIVEGMGLAAIALIVYVVLVGISLMGFKKMSFWSITFKTLVVIIAASLSLGLVSLWIGGHSDLGGVHGRYMNLLLIDYIGWIGAAMVSLLLIVGVFYIYINEITRMYRSWCELRTARRDKAEQQRLKREREQETVRKAMMDSALDDAAEEKHEAIVHDELTFGSGEAGLDDDEFNTASGGPNERLRVSDAFSIESPGIEQAEVEGETTSDDKEGLSPTMEVEVNQIEEGHKGIDTIYDPTEELSNFKMPVLDLLKEIPAKTNSVDLSEQEENKEQITRTLNNYGIEISHIHATVGPTVTLYEIIPAEGVRIAKIKRLEDDIAMSLAALGIRIIAPIPGKGTIGIEVPNKDPQIVWMRSILGSKKFQECKMKLPMAIGATITNEVYIADLAKMPHLLVAGATGMGKSVGLNAIIASLLYKRHPAELKFVLIDPKMVEFSLYSVLERHYLAKLPDEEEAVVTQMDKVLATLNSLCVEMDKRYLLLRDAEVRSLGEYNELFMQRRLNPEKGHRYLPYIVMIVDEFADLIMTAGKDVEKPIARIAQKARAVGMHMIIATQRPSTNVITGIIKANFPGRIAFRVQQMVDSKTILDRTGANQLIGRGDMLFSHNGSLDRVQCAFIDTPEVQAICNHIDKQVGYDHAYYLPEPEYEGDASLSAGSLTDRDPLFEEAAEFIVSSGSASTSSLQRRYSIGYNRAGKIMDQLEAAGIVGAAMGSKPRQVLVDHLQLGSIMHSIQNQ